MPERSDAGHEKNDYAPGEILFTGGGSQADNLAIRGFMHGPSSKGRKHIITSKIEHHAVLYTCEALEKEGYRVTYLNVDKEGHVDLEQLKNELSEDTALVSVMAANNEIGTIQPLKQISELAHSVGAKFHTDAVQGFLKVPFSAKTLGADFITISGHKVGGPKGIGALYIGPRVREPRPLLPGGGQEMGLRSGTEPTAQIAGFAKAVELRQDSLADKLRHMADIKAYAIEQLTAIPDLRLIGDGKAPHVLSVALEGWPSQNIVTDLGSQGICISAGSACHQGKASQVVAALKLPKRVAAGVIRLSFGPETTFEEIDACVEALHRHHDTRMPML